MTETIQPVQISPEAHRALANKMREWSGWPNAALRLGIPNVSPFAETDFLKREFVVNPEYLILNPNRVLLTVTPFRLRQEAVLTGSMLHEAGHARHSHWLPTTPEQAKANPAVHDDGTTPTPQCIALARLMEEPRVEGLIAAEQGNIGAAGLGWTMRAAAARLLPPTSLSPDPNQALMDVLRSWALRAGRQVAYHKAIPLYRLPIWVNDFNKLLDLAIEAVLNERVAQGAELVYGDASTQAYHIRKILIDMCKAGSGADTTSFMLDRARDALALMFPETEDEDDDSDEVMPGTGCGDAGEPSPSESGDEGEGDEQGQDGEGDTEPEDPGEGTEPGAGDAGEGDQDEDGEGQGESESDEQDSEGDQDQSDADEPRDGGSEDEGDGATDSTDDLANALAAALAQIESDSGDAEQAAADKSADEAPTLDDPTNGVGTGVGSGGGTWRMPTIAEREVQRGAERFLRDMIDVSETSKRTLTDQPSATVDGAALAAWKAGGQHTEPRFFIRTHRIQQPSPPVQVAILVDVSASMDSLQAPSALLSWALSSAALNLRNFAGRGAQVQSCLIHWGSRADVIAKNGQAMPGIREVPCDQGTHVMGEALGLVEQEIPGFFDVQDTPVNRLLVQFSDWQMGGVREATPYIERGLASGVNMLNIMPRDYSPRYSSLTDILRQCKVKRGSTSMIQYHKMQPEQVWHQAAQDLAVSAARIERDLTATPNRVAVSTEQEPDTAPFPGF